ncbi:MAG: DNA primase [Azospirillaceae bacterium]|nr:DNA primase [Azospirillaceae bacterium]
MTLPPAFLDELRARLALSDVIGKRLRLIRAGREFKAPCPFHNEKTPSFYVNDQKGFFHCFGCGAHGDIIGFTMRHDNLAFHEAVEQLAALAGMQVPQSTPEDRRRYERQKSLHDLTEAAAQWFEKQLHLPGGRAGLDYLHGRGLSDETIARFRLGFAPSDGKALPAMLAAAGYDAADMVEAGLLKRPEPSGDEPTAARGRDPYSFFRHRVIFPVADRSGRVVAFGARLIQGEGPKYLNSPESPLFHKGRLLYGMARARLAAAEGKPLIVAEGYMDVIALCAAGFTGAVAPLGTAMTESQVLELWKLAPAGQRTPILAFDGDNAGRRAAFRAVERILPLLQPDQSAMIAFLPDGEDPDSLLRKGGPRAMQQVLDAALPLAEMVWSMEIQNRRLDTPEARAGLDAALQARVATIADGTVQHFFRDDMKRRVAAAFDWRAQRRQDTGPGGRPGSRMRTAPGSRSGVPGRAGGRSGGWPAPIQVTRQPPTDVRQHRDRILLATLINHPQLFDEMGEALAGHRFSDPALDGLRQAVIQTLAADSGLDDTGLWRHLCETGLSDVLDGLCCAGTVDLPPFAKREAPLDQAQQGWRDVWTLMQRGQIQQDLAEAGQIWARDNSGATFIRFQAIRREAENGTDGRNGERNDEPDG